MIQDPEKHITASVLKVSAKSNPNSVAGALAAVLRERDSAEQYSVQRAGAQLSCSHVRVRRRLVPARGQALSAG